MEYIIGGIASTFRKSVLDKVGYYDANTVTEDIDLTMKIIRMGNKRYKAVYAADVIAHTEACLSVGDLLAQRYRWKYGRGQTFLKNKNMFFNSNSNYSKQLTYFYLPFALFCDLAFFFEPIMVGYLIYITLRYSDTFTLLSAFVVISTYIIINVLAEDTVDFKSKVKLILIAPTMYLFFFILSFVEYVALIRWLVNIKSLMQNINQKVCHWQHVERGKIRLKIKLA